MVPACGLLEPHVALPRPGLLTKQFGPRGEWGRWFLLDPARTLVASGDLTDGGLVGALLDLMSRGDSGAMRARIWARFAAVGPLTSNDTHARQAFLFVNNANTGCAGAGRIRAFTASAR